MQRKEAANPGRLKNGSLVAPEPLSFRQRERVTLPISCAAAGALLSPKGFEVHISGSHGPGTDKKIKVREGYLIFNFSLNAKPLTNTLGLCLVLLLTSRQKTYLVVKGLETPTPATDKTVSWDVDSNTGALPTFLGGRG